MANCFTGSTGATRIATLDVPRFGGKIWYVDKGNGSDTNSGKCPEEAFETIGANDITDTVDPASAPVGSLLIKDDDATEALTVYSSASNNVIEQPATNQSGQQPIVAFDVMQEAGEDTYIRVTQTGAGASGEIHWHAEWNPVTDDGFLEVA